MFCSQCGAKLPENSKFCHECGNKLLSSSKIVTEKKTEPQIFSKDGQDIEQTIEQEAKRPQNASKNDNSEYDERSGKGKDSIIPKEILEWNWGAAGLGIIWGIKHKVWISLLTLVVPFGWLAMGKAGNGWAWRNNKWKSVEEFKKAQAKWQPWGKIFFILAIVINLAIYLPFISFNNIVNQKLSKNSNGELYINEKIKCKDIGDKYVSDQRGEILRYQLSQKKIYGFTSVGISDIEVDYSPKLNTCLIMLNIHTSDEAFTHNTIKDLSGKYNSTCLLGGNDPIFEQTEAKFHYLITGERSPELPEQYIQIIYNNCKILF